MRRATAAEAGSKPAAPPASEVAVRPTNCGLDALKEKKRQEEEERWARREAARARRHNEETKREADEGQAIRECEDQAREDNELNSRVKYEAALVVRLAVRFGTSGVWMKIAEARSRGADIPLDPKKVYLLAHPDRNPLPEATDATAILNAQRPPEMTEVKAKPHVAAAGRPKEEAPAPPGAPDGGAPEPVPQTSPPPGTPEPAAAAGGSSAEPPAGFTKAPVKAEEEERRVDPEDNKTCTLQELQQKYAGTYTEAEIKAYWRDECRPLPKPRRERQGPRWMGRTSCQRALECLRHMRLLALCPARRRGRTQVGPRAPAPRRGRPPAAAGAHSPLRGHPQAPLPPRPHGRRHRQSPAPRRAPAPHTSASSGRSLLQHGGEPHASRRTDLLRACVVACVQRCQRPHRFVGRCRPAPPPVGSCSSLSRSSNNSTVDLAVAAQLQAVLAVLPGSKLGPVAALRVSAARAATPQCAWVLALPSGA